MLQHICIKIIFNALKALKIPETHFFDINIYK